MALLAAGGPMVVVESEEVGTRAGFYHYAGRHFSLVLKGCLEAYQTAPAGVREISNLDSTSHRTSLLLMMGTLSVNLGHGGYHRLQDDWLCRLLVLLGDPLSVRVVVS